MEYELKPDETGDDSVSLSELENNFNRVVKEIVNDKSLEKFYLEYQKLHEALISSHEQNKVLSSKCTELNQDIVKNAKQISSIVLMTQADQKTIEVLRNEFEKAWNIVETSSEKEQKSRGIIENLKNEVENLSNLIANTEQKPEEDEYSFQTLEEQTTELKNEIKNNKRKFLAI